MAFHAPLQPPIGIESSYESEDSERFQIIGYGLRIEPVCCESTQIAWTLRAWGLGACIPRPVDLGPVAH